MNLISIQISRKLLKIFALLETLFDGEVENTNSHFSKNNLHRSMVKWVEIQKINYSLHKIKEFTNSWLVKTCTIFELIFCSSYM